MSKTEILTAFQNLLNEQQQLSSIATKAEEAEKAKSQELLATACTYTVDHIVKGLADLQLDFGSVVNALTEKLTQESNKLDQLKKAIDIETQELQYLKKVRIAADALHILTQEHRENLKVLQQKLATHQEALTKDIASKRKQWQKEQQEYEITIQELTQLITKQRQQEVEDYTYQIQRQRQIDADQYTEAQRRQERQIEELGQAHEKQWAEREKFLSDHQAEFTENQQKVAGFADELKQAYIKAKDEAIQDATREAKVKSDLLEKEWESHQRGYELKVQSLEQTIQRNNEQITDLANQLQIAMRQAQELAMKAFGTNNK